MRGTALVYSSHDRCEYIHDRLIVQRALRGEENRRILFLPMSETVHNGNELERQEYSYSRFSWYFGFYERYGLEHLPFYWTSSLQKEDVDLFWHYLWSSEVVILGGGHSQTGLHRYKELGARFDGEWGKFGRILHERRRRGLLTVGFSAGADQLCQHLFRSAKGGGGDTEAFGLVRDTMITLHHEPSRNGDLVHAAQQFPECMVFGLANDSGLNVDWGVLPSGNIWQVYEIIIDNSWSEPTDQWHIKTRAGALVEHFDSEGRHWSFHGGDLIVRIQSPDGRFRETWMTGGDRMLHYGTRGPSRFGSVAEILAAH